MKRADIHPRWCGQGHVCTYDRGGEHRSTPVVVDTDHTRLVITRIRTWAGADRIEVRTVLDLPTDPDAGRRYAVAILGRLHWAITSRSTRSRP